MITQLLFDTITRWVKTGQDGFNKSAFATPATLTGRWQDKNELFIDSAGKETVSSAIVYFAESVSVGDYLYLGASATASPDDVSTAYEIKKVGKISDVDNGETLVKAWL